MCRYTLWVHGQSTISGRRIRATVMIDGLIANISTSTPILDSNTNHVVVNGIRFEMRSGPNRISIRIPNNTIATSRVSFAFTAH